MVIIILAFVPVFALTGMEGKMFHPLAFTKTFAMVGSTILAITLVPVLCTFLIRGKLHREEDNPIMRVLRAIYQPIVALGATPSSHYSHRRNPSLRRRYLHGHHHRL